MNSKKWKKKKNSVGFLFTLHYLNSYMRPSIKYVRKNFRKTNISNSLIRTRTCVYKGVRNVSFSESFAYVLNGWPLSALKLLHFSHIIPTQITENTKNVDIEIYKEIAWTFSLAMAQMEYTERELWKYDSFKKLLFVWRTWLTNLKGFPITWWKIKNSRDEW